jgi:hypothetical protein
MAYKKVTDFEEYTENPFVEKAIQDIKMIKKTQTIRPKSRDEIQLIVSGDEVTGHSAFMRFVEVEEEKFAKLYLSQLSAFWDLSKPAIRVFSYILTRLKPKQDNFYFEMESCLEYTKYTHAKNVLSGIADLIEAGIIARTKRHYEYYINPLVIFNGDRVTFAKTYIRKKKEEGNKQLNIFNQNYLDDVKGFENKS